MSLFKLKIQFFKYFTILILLLFMNIYCNKNIFENIYLEHYQKYPLMELVDYYKLTYQAVFGVKHLLIDSTKAKQYLLSELSSITPKNEELFKNISIDSSIVRINLKTFKYKSYNPDILFNIMKTSAEKISGSEDTFYEYWNSLLKLIDNKKILLDPIVAKKYTLYFEKPLKEKHHSEIYIKSYDPHYRVVLKSEFEKFFKR